MKNECSLKQVPENIGWYLSGFVDGEGSFNASLRQRKDHRMKWQIVLTFNVAQKDIGNLILLKKYLNCGRLQARKDGVHYFVVSNYRDIKDCVIPFFERFHFFSSLKRRNFSLFRELTMLMNLQEHLKPEGFKKLVEIREFLNEGKGRKRKYNILDVFPTENPQRLYAESVKT